MTSLKEFKGIDTFFVSEWLRQKGLENEVFESYHKLRVLFDQCDDQINMLTERFYRDAGKYSY